MSIFCSRGTQLTLSPSSSDFVGFVDSCCKVDGLGSQRARPVRQRLAQRRRLPVCVCVVCVLYIYIGSGGTLEPERWFRGGSALLSSDFVGFNASCYKVDGAGSRKPAHLPRARVPRLVPPVPCAIGGWGLGLGQTLHHTPAYMGQTLHPKPAYMGPTLHSKPACIGPRCVTRMHVGVQFRFECNTPHPQWKCNTQPTRPSRSEWERPPQRSFSLRQKPLLYPRPHTPQTRIHGPALCPRVPQGPEAQFCISLIPSTQLRNSVPPYDIA